MFGKVEPIGRSIETGLRGIFSLFLPLFSSFSFFIIFSLTTTSCFDFCSYVMSFYGVLNSVVQRRRFSMCNDIMPVSVKVYFGNSSSSAIEIRRFIFRPEQMKMGCGVYHALLDRIRALFNGLNLYEVHLCWKDDDGDYVVFSSDDELKVAINSTTDNTLRIYIREKELPARATVVNGRHGRSVESYCRKPELSESISRERDSTPLRRHISEIVGDNAEPSSPALTNHADSVPMSLALCGECQGEGRGVWYKCTMCSEFYLCSECENRGLHDQHVMIRMSSHFVGHSYHGTPNLQLKS